MLLLAGVAARASAASYSEGMQGDLSDDRLAPTVWVLENGANALSADFGNGDLDYFAIHIAPGYALQSLILEPSTVTGSGLSFAAFEAGPVMTVSPVTAPTGLNGWTHFSSAQFGTDILDNFATGWGTLGFSMPLPAGVYTFWVQEIESGEGLRYDFTFNVAPVVVPLPAGVGVVLHALALLGLGRGGALLRRVR